MYDIIVVGSGPAGISAAIYASRARHNTAVISENNSALFKTEKIENYYGFAEPISGEKLLSNGISQAQRFGTVMISGQVVDMGYEDGFTVKTKDCEYRAPVVILATGSNRTAPKIEGFTHYEGAGISYCAICDALFYKGRDVAVLGCCEYALHEAMELLAVAKSVTLLTNGVTPIPEIPKEIPIIQKSIRAFEGDPVLDGVRFSDGTKKHVEGVFIAIGVAGSSDLAKKLGAQTDGLKIIVDENMATSIPGLYAAGDCTGGLMQIAKAVYEGAKAGTEAGKYLREKRKA